MVGVTARHHKSVIEDVKFIFVMICPFRAHVLEECLVYEAGNRQPSCLGEHRRVAEQLVTESLDRIQRKAVCMGLPAAGHWRQRFHARSFP